MSQQSNNRKISRLEKTYRRLEAQMLCSKFAFGMIEGRAGVVAELGLGLGRTYDHLRRHLLSREIYAFDRANDAYPDCQPDPAFFIGGEIEETFPALAAKIGGRVILANTDLGSFDREQNARVAAMMSRILPPAMAMDGIIMSDLPLDMPGCVALPLPAGAQEGCYYLYQRRAER